MKTGIKFKPCNVGTAEAHNRRDRAYCEAITRKYGHTYFWGDRRHLNVSWRSPSYPQPLPDLLEELKVMVKEKTGRAMQCKPVEFTDRKTGKKKTRAGSSAIREGCPPIKPDTRIEDFDKFVEWLTGKGISVISIDLHHDEGHADPETDDLMPNHHAHIIVDWMNHATGKSVKLDAEECKEMQTVLADSLGMERGTPKQDTGIEGLSAIEYKERMARENHRRLTAEASDLEDRKQQLESELSERKRDIDDLERQRQEKKRQLDEESGSALKSGLANFLGKGRYAEVEKENARLTDENTTLKRENAKLEAQVSKLPMMAERQAKRIIDEHSQEHQSEIRLMQSRHDTEMSALRDKINRLAKRYQSLEDETTLRIHSLEQEKKGLLARLDAMIDMLGERLENAVRALIEFAKNAMIRCFSREHQAAIVPWLHSRWFPTAADNAELVKIFARPFLDDRDFDKGCRELDNLVSSLPTVTEELNRPESRGPRR